MNTGTIVFLQDDRQRDRWRIGLTDRPVTDFARLEGKRLRVKVYGAHVCFWDADLVKQIETYLGPYAQPEGWFGPLSDDAMRELAVRIWMTSSGFLGMPMPKP